MSAAANFPSSVMLERFVFRMDDKESFPDESTAPIRASGATSWCAPFRVAFELNDAPKISRMYAQLPGFPSKQTPLAILATHHHLVLFRVGMEDTSGTFIYDASNADSPSSSLVRLPTCTLLDKDELKRIRRRPSSVLEYRRVMNVASMGLLSRGEGERDFAVAELSFVLPDEPFVPPKARVHADLFFLRSSEPGSDDAGLWNYARLAVSNGGRSHLTWSDFRWQTDKVIPADKCLCWIDYHRGMVSCNLFQELPLGLTFNGFPQDEFSLAKYPIIASCWFYCGASAIEAGRALKIVRVIRHDGKRYGTLETDASFTITCHTYRLDTTAAATVWKRYYQMDCTVTSEELWSCNTAENLPRKILMFPQVHIDRPNIIHFLIIDKFKFVLKKMFLVTIDTSTRVAESCLYIKGQEDIGTVYAELMKRRSSSPQSFLSGDFSKFLNITRDLPHHDFGTRGPLLKTCCS